MRNGTQDNYSVEFSASSNDKLKDAEERADRAEAELAELKGQSNDHSHDERSSERELRRDPMMAHLLDSLEAQRDIGHYGRLVFTMVARHFMPSDEVLSWLIRDPDFGTEEASVMLRQVEERDYNPPRRERILQWQQEQEFPILPNSDDPDCGNVYRTLKFPDSIYEHIEHYQEQKTGTE